jgi:transposase
VHKLNRDKRNHIFRCRSCGYTSNDDRIGAMNLYRMGIGCHEGGTVPDTAVVQHV